MVALPFSEAAFRRHRRSQQGGAAVIAAGAVLFVAALLLGHGRVALGGVALALAGLVGVGIVEMLTWVGLRFEPVDGAVIVTRCHPAFVDGVRAARASPHERS